MTIDRVGEIDHYQFKPRDFFRNIDEALVERYKEVLGPRLIDPASNGLILSFPQLRHHWAVNLTITGRHLQRQPQAPTGESPGSTCMRSTYLRTILRKSACAPTMSMWCSARTCNGDHVG
jgi:hypothetical protein